MEGNTKIQFFRDESLFPTAEIIADGLGKANAAYIKFVEELRSLDISLMEWRYYNDGKAWLTKGEYKRTTMRGTVKVKPLFWLSVWEGFFRVCFYVSSDIREILLSLPVSAWAMEAVEGAKAMGKTMRMFPIVLDITNESQLNDVLILAQFRKNE